MKFTFIFSSIVALSSLAENVPIIISLTSNLMFFLLLCYFASQINEKSTETSVLLNKIDDTNYPEEMRQFQRFLNSTKIALSGKGFFAITKGMMLSVSFTKNSQKHRLTVNFSAHRNYHHV